MASASREGERTRDLSPQTDEDFEEVLCERECNAGFKVLLGRTLIVLVCTKCHQEYEMSPSGESDDEEGAN
jgi:hypothetical protein